jgi:thiamine biosynthesis lipoprotein
MAKRSTVLFILGFLLLGGFGCKPRVEWRQQTLFVFDTVCDFKFYCTESEFKAARQSIMAVFQNIQEKFSPEADDVSSPLVLDLFRKSRQAYEDSNRAFDITVKPLSRLWGFQHNSNYVPTAAQVQGALKHVGMTKVRDEGTRLVLEPGMGLDWGGIAKGLAVDLAARAVMARGFIRGFINAGGNLYCWGKNPDGGPWKVGVKHPRRAGLMGVLSLEDMGAATSGDYQRYFESGGVRYHHIFDPKTGYPARGKQSVTIIGPEAVVCDTLSTALFVSLEPENILKKYQGYGAIIVDDKGLVSFLGKRFPFQPTK